MDSSARDQTRQWLARWQRVGPLLDEERWERLAVALEQELAWRALDLLALWRPETAGDDGEGLLLQQRALRRLPLRPVEPR